MQRFVRFQSAVPNRNGRFPGVFALANGLAHDGMLLAEDEAWWRAANDRANSLYDTPTEAYGPGAPPGGRSWFKAEAHDILTLTEGYLGLLDRYEVPWHELRTTRPGRILYEDPVQVVALPHTHPDDWPFSARRS
ncbi:hypothetical protein [Microbacterium sp. cf332]|uniref:hypothetical protein n=1 Tax=Microbacterium sp. cf332 TaxID=1761804 RepID=UPI000883F4C2|nr:hypothetical protein [Microbacterium sp. cf332]SDQ62392.1 hypothetical protein SAMN04487847_2121 [Microbacterium sp. cf332]